MHTRAGLVQLGLGALARGDLLGLLGARGAGRGLFAMGVGDLAAMTLELALRAALARMRGIGEGDERQRDQHDDDDGDDDSGGHGPLLSVRHRAYPAAEAAKLSIA